MDYRAGRTLLVRSDDMEAELPLSAPPNTSIAGARFFPALPFYLVRLHPGKEILFELPENGNDAPLRERKVIYLDQNAWSRLVQIHSGIPTGNDDETRAGARILELVSQNQLILPFSGATLTETSRWTRSKDRLRLGEFILEFSRGWQMRDPLTLRRQEIAGSLRRRSGEEIVHAAPSPWTLSPVAIGGFQPTAEKDGFLSQHPDLIQLMDAVLGVDVVVDTLLSEDPLPRIDREGWCDHWNQLSAALRESPAAKENRAKGALFGALMDAREEVRLVADEIGLDATDAAEWLCQGAFKDYAQMPAFGIACEVTRLKLTSGARWHMNDLADIFYYVQAAGYAHAVVGERSFTAHIRNAQKRLNRPQTAFRSFRDLLESDLLEREGP